MLSALIVQGISTTFGSEYSLDARGNLRRDPGDNSKGFYNDPKTGQPYNTFSQTLLGCSLPIPVIDFTLGHHYLPEVRRMIESGAVEVWVTGQNNVSVKCVITDIGPAVWTHHLIDLTWMPSHDLATDGEQVVNYEILRNGQKIPILGWDLCHGIKVA
jgi:hypothetical protein